MPKPIAVLKGKMVNDLFFVALKVNGSKVHPVVVDTGAATLIFNGDVARRLKLPNLGRVLVGGVGGTVSAFRSKCNLEIGKRLYKNVPCVVITGFSKQALLGLKFFRDRRLALFLDPSKQTLKIYSQEKGGQYT